MLHFNDFRDGKGGELCCRLGIDISMCETWSEFTAAMVHFNDKTDGGLIEAARRLDGVGSTGERALLHAVLSAADFSRLADELSGGTVWLRLDYVFGDHRMALAACVARLDRGRDRLAPGVADGNASRSRQFLKASQGDGTAV